MYKHLFIIIFLFFYQSLSKNTSFNTSGTPLVQLSTSGIPLVQLNATKKEERFYSEAITHLLEDGQKFLTIIGVCVSAFWTYYKFFHARTFQDRLELEITGEIVQKSNLYYLLVEYSLKNIGLTKTDIKEAGSYLTVVFPLLATNLSGKKLKQVDWDSENKNTINVFLRQPYIEPNETIKEQVLYLIPDNLVSEKQDFPFKVELGLNIKHSSWTRQNIINLNKKCEIIRSKSE